MLAIINPFDLTPNPDDRETLVQAIREAKHQGYLSVTLAMGITGEPDDSAFVLDLRVYHQGQASRLASYFEHGTVPHPWPANDCRVGEDEDGNTFWMVLTPTLNPEAVRDAIITWTREVAQNEDGAEGMTIVGSEVGVEQTETGRPYRFWYDGAIRQLD